MSHLKRSGGVGAPKKGSGKCRNKARVAAATKKGVRGANDYARASRTNSPMSFVLSDIFMGTMNKEKLRKVEGSKHVKTHPDKKSNLNPPT